MNFFCLLLFMFLGLRVGFCKSCSEGLHKAFKNGFNVNKGCGDKCIVLNSEIVFENKTWTGFCFRDEYALFPDWECQVEVTKIKNVAFFVLTNGKFCLIKSSEEIYNLNENCLIKYNNERCRRMLASEKNYNNDGFRTEKNQNNYVRHKNFKNQTKALQSQNPIPNTEVTVFSSVQTFPTINSSSYHFSIGSENEFVRKTTIASDKTTRTSHIPNNSIMTSSNSKTPSHYVPTYTFPKNPTKTTSINSPHTYPTPHTTSLPHIKTSHLKTTQNTFPSKPTRPNPPHVIRKTCEENEYFFNDHCYFMINYMDFLNDNLKKYQEKSENEMDFSHSSLMDPSNSCKQVHPKALALAVETVEENDFIMNYVKQIRWLTSPIILTSGIREYSLYGIWKGWGSKINDSILNLPTNDIEISPRRYYYINPCQQIWNISDILPKIVTGSEIVVICERLYNPKNINVDLHEKCLKLYRESKCHSRKYHSNYCCAKDYNGNLWFGCPNRTINKTVSNRLLCSWNCSDDGVFFYEYPSCEGKISCEATYNNIKYHAPINSYALSTCPKPLFGYSSWYCDRNGRFVDLPDYSVCCKTNILCIDFDPFLSVWAACPGKIAQKLSQCPAGSTRKNAMAEWYCNEDGKFNGTSPNYSNCYRNVTCRKIDKFGRIWIGEPGTTTENECPSSLQGSCFWRCNQFGKFENPQPDCSHCRDKWMDEIAEEIKKENDHRRVIEKMANYTKKKDLALGFSHVLNLTSECVGLFRKQNSKNTTQTFDTFLNGYSKILKNVAANTELWSTFLVSNRKVYAKEILNVTEKAAFSNLGFQNYMDKQEGYNGTFANFKNDGFDFFVSYNSSLKGLRFPFQNISESSWQLEIKEVNNTGIDTAAMGLVMNHSLSDLMFPIGEETKSKELNAPAVTFTVATSNSEETVIVSEVVVSLSFKHTYRTKYPQSEVIKRRLHEGEKPSGIFNSTVCYYYKNSEWSTEGCSVTYTSMEETNCTCTHLSTIALLMSVHQYKPDIAMETVSLVTSIVSIMSLILTLIIFYSFDSNKNERSFIGKNLCICLLLGHILLITVLDKRFFYIPDTLCTLYAILIHYIFMAAFAWMFVEGCHLYRMLVVVFDSDIEYRCIYLLIGYGVPLVIVGSTQIIGLVFQEQPYGQDELCWLKAPNYVWAFLGPVVLVSGTNFLILITAMKLAIASKMRTEKSNFASFKIWVKGWITLSTLLGVTWLFSIAFINSNEIVLYTFGVLNGLQGFFIFVFRCVLNEQYKSVLFKKLKSIFLCSDTPDDLKKSENKSGTKIFGIGRSGSKSSEDIRRTSGYDSSTTDRIENQMDVHRRFNESFNKSFSNKKSKGNDDYDSGTGYFKNWRKKNSEVITRNGVDGVTSEKKKKSRVDSEDSGISWSDPDFPELSYHFNYIS